MHPAEVVVWFKKLAKLLGKIFREGEELLQLACQEYKSTTQVKDVLERTTKQLVGKWSHTSLIPILVWE